MDQELFRKIRKDILPQEGTIKILRKFDAAIPFRMEDLDDLGKYIYFSDDSDFEFMNPDLNLISKENIT